MAEAYHIQVAPHCYCGPIVAAANIQLAATLPNFLILEAIKTWDGFHEKLLKKKIEWQDGEVIPSKEPGLGVELDEAVCDAHPYDGQAPPPADGAGSAVSLSVVSRASATHRDRTRITSNVAGMRPGDSHPCRAMRRYLQGRPVARRGPSCL